MAEPSQSLPRILVVEDQMMLAMGIVSLLQDIGYDPVGPVGRVVTALPMAIREPLDAALLDFDLAGESVEPIAEVLGRRGIPFALLSAYDRGDLPPALRGCPYIRKPFGDAEIEAAVGELLGRPSPRRTGG